MGLEAPLLPRRCRHGAGVVLTPAKLNLFLEVEARRRDGFHDLTTLMIPIHWQDHLRVTSRAAGHTEDCLRVRGVAVPTGRDNLVRRAVDAIRKLRQVPPLDMELTKRLPIEAGLGGGSGNAAGTLVLVDELFDLGLPTTELQSIASGLGSDVPFFLGSGPAICRGRGEQVQEFAASGQPKLFGGDDPYFVVVTPSIGCSTPAIFGALSFPLTSPDGPISFQNTTFEDSSRWPEGIFNRLEAIAITSASGGTTSAPSDSGRLQRHVTGNPDRRKLGCVPSGAGVDSPGNITMSSVSNWLRQNASELWPSLLWPSVATDGARNWALTGSGSAFFVAARNFGDAQRFAARARTELGVGASVHRVFRPDRGC